MMQQPYPSAISTLDNEYRVFRSSIKQHVFTFWFFLSVVNTIWLVDCILVNIQLPHKDIYKQIGMENMLVFTTLTLTVYQLSVLVQIANMYFWNPALPHTALINIVALGAPIGFTFLSALICFADFAPSFWKHKGDLSDMFVLTGIQIMSFHIVAATVLVIVGIYTLVKSCRRS